MLDPVSYWSRVMATMQMIGTTGARMMETAVASNDVIAARTELIGAAARSPLTGDYPELARMVPEKVAAFSAAGVAVAQAMSKAQADGLARATGLASKAFSGRMVTPLDVAGYWNDVSLDMLRAMESASRLGRDSLAPLHRTATSNARRLKKTRG